MCMYVQTCIYIHTHSQRGPIATGGTGAELLDILVDLGLPNASAILGLVDIATPVVLIDPEIVLIQTD